MATWKPDIVVGIDFGMTCTGEISLFRFKASEMRN